MTSLTRPPTRSATRLADRPDRPGRGGLAARVLIALVAGALAGLAFPPGLSSFHLPPAVPYAAEVVAIAVLFGGLRGLRRLQPALVGFAFGVGLLGVAVRWLSVLGGIAVVPLVAFEALFFAAGGLLMAAALRLRGWQVWAPAAWVLMEAGRSRFPFGGFTWARAGYLSVGTPMGGYARLGAVPLSSFVVAVFAALLVWCLASRGVRSRGRVGAVLVAAALAFAGLLVPAFTRPAGSATVALVQGSVPGKGLDFLGRARTVTRNHLQGTRRLAADVRAGTLPRPAFVVWPENSTDIDPFTDALTQADIDAAVHSIGTPILVGAVLDGPGPDKARNVGIVWNPGTGPGAIYVKRHLVPFGEYIPMRSLMTSIIPWIADYIPRDLVPGHRSGALTIAGVRVGDMLCFDTAYDDAPRADVQHGARLLVVQTNNATYTDTGQPDQQWQVTRFDALAFGRAAVVASTNGRSGIIDAAGHDVATLPMLVQAYTSQRLQLRTGRTPAVWLAPWVEAGLATVGALAAAGGWARGRRRGPARGRSARPASTRSRRA